MTTIVLPRFGWVRAWLALALVGGLVLVSCGDDDDDGATTTQPTEVMDTVFDASPTAMPGLPQDVDTAEVAIIDGQIEPDTITGRLGQSFVLLVEGDGTERTLEIESIVADFTIGAEGVTQVSFTVPEEQTGFYDIRIDGETVGTFEAQTPGGVT